jgi:hypothetical protein
MPDARVVGWDILDYDLPIVRNSAHTNATTSPLPTLDLSVEIKAATGRRYRLDFVARANLGHGKSMDSQTVIGWLRAGDPNSMIKATEHCRNNVQQVMDLLNLLRNQPLVLPGRQEPDERGRPRKKEDTLRVYFTPEGEWLRCEDQHGKLIKERGG